MTIRTLCGSLAMCGLVLPASVLAGAPIASAKNGDTHITGQGINQTLDCNDAALLVTGTGNYITAKGSCWGVAVQGSSNVIIVDNVVNDIVVYGFDQTVYYKSGDPSVNDVGRQLGMTNRIDRVPA